MLELWLRGRCMCGSAVPALALAWCCKGTIEQAGTHARSHATPARGDSTATSHSDLSQTLGCSCLTRLQEASLHAYTCLPGHHGHPQAAHMHACRVEADHACAHAFVLPTTLHKLFYRSIEQQLVNGPTPQLGATRAPRPQSVERGLDGWVLCEHAGIQASKPRLLRAGSNQ